MTIQSLDDYLTSSRQILNLSCMGQMSSSNAQFISGFMASGYPGSPTSAPAGNTANGIVPVGGAGGYPRINAFAGGATGYLARFVGQNSGGQSMHLNVADRLFYAGAYTGASGSVTLASVPSYTSRLPSGDATGTELFVEAATSTFQAGSTVTVGYTNESGVSGRTATVTAGATLGSGGGGMLQIPLQAGDKGVQSIQSVTWSGCGASSGFNVTVVRVLVSLALRVQCIAHVSGLMDTGLPEITADAALFLYADTTGGFGYGYYLVEVASK